VYAIGGNDGHRQLRTAERYNYTSNQWSLIASMNMQRSGASAAVIDGKAARKLMHNDEVSVCPPTCPHFWLQKCSS
jgi:hypothetical protein